MRFPLSPMPHDKERVQAEQHGACHEEVNERFTKDATPVHGHVILACTRSESSTPAL